MALELYRRKQQESQDAIDAKQDRPLVYARYGIDNSSTTSLNLPVGSFNAVDFNVEIEDNYNAVTTGAGWNFEVPEGEGGLYRLAVDYLIQDNGVGFTAYTIGYLRVNGVLVKQATTGWVSGTPFPTCRTEIEMPLSEGDTVTFEWHQNAGPSRLIEDDPNTTSIEISKLGN